MSTAAAILVAAGSGERLGFGRPKALIDLAGRPLFLHALGALATCGRVSTAVIAAPAGSEGEVEDLAAPLSGAMKIVVCRGGASRAASVQRGLAALPRGEEVVAVHDAARALVSPSLIERTIAALEPPWDAVAPALPVVDTLKRVDGERVVETVQRESLRAVQTPQVFPRSVLEAAHARLDPDDLAATDDLVAVERAGGRVRLIPGERTNLKITFPEDLAVAAALLKADGR